MSHKEIPVNSPEKPTVGGDIAAELGGTKAGGQEWLGPALGLLGIRIWLGIRALMTGVEKFAGTNTSEAAVVIDGEANSYGLSSAATEKVYALSNYRGIPEALRTKFEAEPLLPDFFLGVYNAVLGPALLLLGVAVLLGILPRLSLFCMALLYVSLTFGLVLIKQDSGVAWLGTHMVLIALALLFADRDRFALLGKKW